MHEVDVVVPRAETETPWIPGRLYECKYGAVFLATKDDRLYRVAGRALDGGAGSAWCDGGRLGGRFGPQPSGYFKLLPPGTRVTITVGEGGGSA